MRACRGLAAACALLHLLLVVAQHDGSCLPVEEVLSRVQPLLNELITLAAGSGDQHEGNCVTNHGSLEPMPELVAKQRNLVRLAQEYGGRGVLEVGFNSGLSAALFLSASPTTRVTSIDIGLHTYVAPCAQLLQQRFPGRFQLIVGDSADVLRRLPPEVVAGLFHVDGSHEVAHARQDLDLAHARMLEGGALLMDDTDTPSLSALLDTLMQSHLGEYDELRYESDGLMASSSRFRHRAIVKAPSTRTVAATQLPSVRACQPEGGAGPTASSARPLREGGALAYRCVSADCFARAAAPSALGARIVAQSHRQLAEKQQRSMAITSGFDTVYEHDLWADGGEGGGSGPGSSINATRTVSALLVHTILGLGANSLLDAPCGAMMWMPGVLEASNSLRAVPGLVGTGDQSTPPPFRYTGIDIVGHVVASAASTHGAHSHWRFVHADVTDPQLDLAPHDLVLCRDLFFHLSNGKIQGALRNFKQSGSTWLLATHNAHALGPNGDHAAWNARGSTVNARGETVVLPPGWKGGLDEGGYRPVNLRLPPFSLPAPDWEWVEWRHPHSRDWDKVLSMWRLSKLTAM